MRVKRWLGSAPDRSWQMPVRVSGGIPRQLSQRALLEIGKSGEGRKKLAPSISVDARSWTIPLVSLPAPFHLQAVVTFPAFYKAFVSLHEDFMNDALDIDNIRRVNSIPVFSISLSSVGISVEAPA